MPATVDSIERTVHKTNEWLSDQADELGTGDKAAAQLGAQLPRPIRTLLALDKSLDRSDYVGDASVMFAPVGEPARLLAAHLAGPTPAADGRGRVLYLRHDGDYGLVEPE